MGNYNKLLEKAKGVYKTCTTDAERKVIESIFPELKEEDSESYRIRKNTINIIRNAMEGNVIPLPLSIYKESIAWLEKQGEKKSADTVESKFKVGDWIVQNGVGVYKIVEVFESWYEVISYNNDGMEIQYSIGFDKENDCHLWTIEDAKDGDVLAGHEYYVIFKEIDGLNIRCHCAYHYMGYNTSFYVETLQNKTAFHPAIKEQRDALFQKMKEAGYEWDYDNKALIDSISEED